MTNSMVQMQCDNAMWQIKCDKWNVPNEMWEMKCAKCNVTNEMGQMQYYDWNVTYMGYDECNVIIAT